MGNIDIGGFILYMVALLFSLSLHEAAHAWTSNYFGDDLARLQGRITLNPVAHIDPIGTLLFPALAFFTGGAMFGWAKPTPVNPLRWRNKNIANIWVSAAGVICNFGVALVSGITIRILFTAGIIDAWPLVPVHNDSLIVAGAVELLQVLFTLNIILAAFNLIPIPPLDGSKILSSFLPRSLESVFDSFERFGFILLFALVFTGALRPLFRVVMSLAIGILFIGA
jgi:Zn-dependent protease